MKKLLTVLLILVALSVAGYFGYQYYQSTQPAPTAAIELPRYQQVAVRRGNLSQSVTGTGTVSISLMENVSLDYAITVKGKVADVGEKVVQGQALLTVDQEALKGTLAALQEELATCESDMAAISNQFSSDGNLKIPLSGRVKEVYIQAGQYVQDVMAVRGSIALLSLDGLMMVEVDAVESMAVNDSVKVQVGSASIDGVIRELSGGTAKISFSDAYGSPGQEVEVFYQQQSIGTGHATINTPYLLATTEKGFVTDVYMEVNSRKWAGNRIATLTHMPLSSEYEQLQSKRGKLTAQLADAQARLAAGTVDSPIDGIVFSIVGASTMATEANTTLASLYVGDQKEMIVSVDELDIVHVQVGQMATIRMDAVTDKIYLATVTRISQIGTSSGGVTVYDVVLSIEGDGLLRIGMNGTATIQIKQAIDVLLIPISALNTSREGQYVWLHDESASAESGEPGIRAFVTTGMSDANFVEVLSGLEEGDMVMLTRESTPNNRDGFRMNMGDGVVFFQGAPMPVGGPGGGTTIIRDAGGGSNSGGGR